MTCQVDGYYTTNGTLYKTDIAQNLQDEAREASNFVLSMIKDREINDDQIRTWTSQSNIGTIDTYNTVRPTRPALIGYNGFGCFYCNIGSCGSGSGSGKDGCLIIVLIITIGILFATFIAGLFLTSRHAEDAVEAKEKANEAKNRSTQSPYPEIRDIYANAAHVQKREWVSLTSKTIFTAAGAIGVACLTVSAIFALYAACNTVPCSPLTRYFAIAGGATVGVGLVGHAMRAISLKANRRRDLEALHNLFNQTVALEVAHPFHVLNPGSYAEHEGYRYILHNDLSVSKTPLSQCAPNGGYTRYVLPNYST